MEALYFSDFIRAHIEKSDSHRIFIDKFKTKEIARNGDLKIPDVFSIFNKIDDICFDFLPNRFALKLPNLAAKKGIYLLESQGDEVYHEYLTNRKLTLDVLKEEMSDLTNGKGKNIIAEQFIFNELRPIPYDYKLFVFDEGVKLITQIDRNGEKDKLFFYDGEFNPIDIFEKDSLIRCSKSRILIGDGVIPRNYKDIISAANSALKVSGRPFLRVDLYSDGESVYVGELTPTPGAPYYAQNWWFSASFDLALGEMMRHGYLKRGWVIPMIDGLSPARKKNKV